MKLHLDFISRVRKAFFYPLNLILSLYLSDDFSLHLRISYL